jgi:serine/threonine protein phosphatase PrpC
MSNTTTPLRELFIESDTPSAVSCGTAVGRVMALCRTCPEKAEPNDDSAAVVHTPKNGVVLVVADGVGGCPLGYKASSIAVHCVVESVEAIAPGSDLRPAILDAIESANHEIRELGIGAATTLSVVEITGRPDDPKRYARIYNVGDCMTLIVGQRGALKWKSTPHSPIGYAIESGMLDELEAMTHDERHLVSNLVGSPTMHIEVGPSLPLALRDTVIVASDGLFDNLHLDEVIRLGRCGKLSKRMQQLSDLATRRMHGLDDEFVGKPDDLTILLFTPQ